MGGTMYNKIIMVKGYLIFWNARTQVIFPLFLFYESLRRGRGKSQLIVGVRENYYNSSFNDMSTMSKLTFVNKTKILPQLAGVIEYTDCIFAEG